jgi:hypothetical protein
MPLSQLNIFKKHKDFTAFFSELTSTSIYREIILLYQYVSNADLSPFPLCRMNIAIKSSTHATIFASQGLRFGSPFSPPLADLEYILRIRALIFHWLRLPVHVSNQKTFYTERMLSTKCKQKWHRNALVWQRFATSRFGSNENIFPVCQSFETFTWLTVSASKLNLSGISFSSLGAAIFNSPTYV